MASKITPSQTIGPFPHEAWRWAFDATTKLKTSARTITISGVVRDGDGKPVSDAVLEAWMPDSASAESAMPLPGFRRVASDDNGNYSLQVSQPAAAASGKPVMFVTIFARGVVRHQFTAVFLEDDTGLAQSEILHQVPSSRHNTLIARKQKDGQYQWDIRLQSEKETEETVFFDYV